MTRFVTAALALALAAACASSFRSGPGAPQAERPQKTTPRSPNGPDKQAPQAKAAFTLDDLFEAIDGGDSARVDAILERGFDVNQSSEGLTPLHRALYNGELDIATRLLRHGSALDVDDDIDGLPLSIVLYRLGRNTAYEAIAIEMVEKGSPLLVMDKDQNTSLMLSARAGSQRLVELLLQGGVPVNAQNRNGQTALDVAEAAHHQPIAELLKRHGARRGNNTSGKR
jgi:uncharacterized protein